MKKIKKLIIKIASAAVLAAVLASLQGCLDETTEKGNNFTITTTAQNPLPKKSDKEEMFQSTITEKQKTTPEPRPLPTAVPPIDVEAILSKYVILEEFTYKNVLYYIVSPINQNNTMVLLNAYYNSEVIPSNEFESLTLSGDCIITQKGDYKGLYSLEEGKHVIEANQFVSISEEKVAYPDLVGEFEGYNGWKFRELRVPNDEKYAPGIWDVKKQQQIVACKTYDGLYEDYFFGPYHIRVSVPNDKGYVKGIMDIRSGEIVLPCKTYDDLDYFFFFNKVLLKVSVPDDDDYTYGIIDLNTMEVVVPCKTYTNINFIYDSFSRDYLEVSVPGDEGFVKGRIGENFEVLLPCKTYDYMGESFTGPDGEKYCEISVPGDNGYINGYMRMSDYSVVVECKTYTDINKYTVDGVNYIQFIQPDGDPLVLKLEKDNN